MAPFEPTATPYASAKPGGGAGLPSISPIAGSGAGLVQVIGVGGLDCDGGEVRAPDPSGSGANSCSPLPQKSAAQMSPVAGSTVTRRMALKYAVFTGGSGQDVGQRAPMFSIQTGGLAGDMLMFHTAMRSLPVSATYA